MSDQRFDPMKELNNLRNTVEKALEQGGKVLEQGIQNVQQSLSAGAVHLDVYEVGDEVIVRSGALDGLAGDSIEVSMEGEELTIKGETRPEETPLTASYFLQERRFGAFERTVTIPIPVKSNEARAKLKSNVLTITLPIDRDRHQDITITPTE